jgi:3-phosphoshikimate 1-carboxyvinyltransferase
MESRLIQPIEPFDAIVRPPGSKSLTNRALLLAAMAKGDSILTGVLFADDTRVMLQALQDLGYGVKFDEGAELVTISGDGGGPPNRDAKLHMGNAGTAMRFLTAACCLGFGEYELDGIPRMRQRPIGQLVDALRELGADIDYLASDGYPPLRINAEGPGLSGGPLSLPATLSSQYISALLQVAPYMGHGLDLELQGAAPSVPYIKMTLHLMKKFGAKSEAAKGYRAVHVPTGKYRAVNYDVEPDASNASYFLAAAAVVPGSRCTIEGLGSRSLQGDAEFCDVLGRMGCSVHQHLDETTVIAPEQGGLYGIDIDLNHMPDMAQTLAVVALFADGPTTIRNIGNLRVKETDRIAALEKELTKLGARVIVLGDDLTIEPPAGNRLKPASIDTYDDHRMAMSFTVAGLAHPGITINDPACVSKTFPSYYEFMQDMADQLA